MNKPDTKQHQDEHYYDIIGDVHGYYTELQQLLIKLGYSSINGIWTHAYRKAVFIGDFIDRGPNSKAVISLIRDMVNAGSALAILGNHEMNAILYFTKLKDGLPIRVPSNNNKRLLDRFAKEYESKPDKFDRDIKWLKTLPLFLKLNGIRIVHAYWNDNNINMLSNLYKNGKLKKKRLKNAIKEDSPLYKPLMETIKGIEIRMPSDMIIRDQRQIKRETFRIKWWEKPRGKTFRQLSFGNRFQLPDYTVPSELIPDFEVYPKKAPIVFIGHYCIGNSSLLAAKNICCVDACITNARRLAAYRYNGEIELDETNFEFIKRPQLVIK